MRAPVQLPRQEGPGESPLERQLGLWLSFDPGPDLAEHVVHLELGAVRAADAAVDDPAASGPGEPVEVRLRSVLAELGLDAGSVALLSSAATTLAAVRTGGCQMVCVREGSST